MVPTNKRAWGLGFFVAAVAAFGAAALNASGSEAPLAKMDVRAMSNAELARATLRADTYQAAYAELVHRAAAIDAPWVRHLDDTDVVVCPQGEKEDPLYVALYPREHSFSVGPDPSYSVAKPYQLFGFKARLIERGTVNVSCWTQQGEQIDLFPADQEEMSGVVLADLNADGIVERVSTGWDKLPDVGQLRYMEVQAVEKPVKPLLCVLFDWGVYGEWYYHVVDRDGDGLAEIELGPTVGGAVTPEVIYRWDAVKGAYVGPPGKGGDHFRVLAPAHVKRELARLKAEHLTFPHARPPEERRGFHVNINMGEERGERQGLSRPYRYASLQGLTNEQIVAYMGKGRQAPLSPEVREIVQPSQPRQVCPGFWTMDPKAAALATAEANEGKLTRQYCVLAVDDRTRDSPPSECSLVFGFWQTYDIGSWGVDLFLRCSHDDSYLIVTTDGGGLSGLKGPPHGFRLCRLDYADAKQVVQTIWWLSRVRSWPPRARGPDGEVWDPRGSAQYYNGHGDLRTISADGELLNQRKDDVYWRAVSQEWRGSYTRVTAMSLAMHILYDELPKRLGQEWSRWQPKRPFDFETVLKDSYAGVDADERSRLAGALVHVLGLFSLDERGVSLVLVQKTAGMAGDLGLTDQLPRLRAIRQALPKPDETEDALSKVDAEQRARAARGVTETELIPPLARQRLDLENKLGEKGTALFDLREALDEAIGRLERMQEPLRDPDRVQQLVLDGGKDAKWALEALRKHFPDRYVAVLERQLPGLEGFAAASALEHMAEVDKAAALRVASAVDPAKDEALTQAAFELLQKANAPIDEQSWIHALLATALDPKKPFAWRGNRWIARCRAIDLLVPPKNPMRYREEEIDESLAKLLNPALGDETINFTLVRAARALALRTGAAHFREVAAVIHSYAGKDGDQEYMGLLSALALMAQQGGPSERAALSSIVAPHLKAGHGRLDDVVWCIWSADLRDLKPDLERIATSGPDDQEGARGGAWSSDAKPVDARYDLPRKVVAIWNEDDPVTRAKLLLAFGFENAVYITGTEDLDRPRRMKADLTDLARTLTADQMAQVSAFLDWCEDGLVSAEPEQILRERLLAFGGLARQWLGLPTAQGSRGEGRAHR